MNKLHNRLLFTTKSNYHISKTNWNCAMTDWGRPIRTFTYDAMGRPLRTIHQVGTGAQMVVSDKTYDEVGRQTGDLRNSIAVLKEIREYNIRSWLTKISGPRFSEYLEYENSSVPQWGGNISAIGWGNNSTSVQKSYQYRYDSLSRLVSATCSGAQPASSCSESFAYDENGNMIAHIRGGQTTPYGLSGNRLMSIMNHENEYDAKGRMIHMSYSPDVGTDYNILDLPQRHIV